MRAKHEPAQLKPDDGFIKAKLYYEKTGETKDSFANKKKKGKIIRDFHYIVASDGTWVHYKRMQEWVESQQQTCRKV